MSRLLGVVVSALMLTPLAASAQTPAAGILSRKLMLDGRNDEWVGANLKVKSGDLVLVFAKGQVKIGEWSGSFDANGQPNSRLGSLQIKVGTGEVFTTGTQWMKLMQTEGAVKFKVFDTSYTDNKGQFEVTVIVIPSSIIPEPTVVEPE